MAVIFGLEAVVKATIQNDTDVNHNDKNGWIPLHTAAAFGKPFKELTNKVDVQSSVYRFELLD